MEQKDSNNSIGSLNGQKIISFDGITLFQKGEMVSIIIKKTEKIATALYMVTDFLSDTEPLKNELRSCALSLISRSQILGTRFAEPRLTLPEDLIRKAEETITYITLGKTIGILSEMNAAILSSEIGKVCTDVEKMYGQSISKDITRFAYSGVVLSEKNFEIDKSEKPQQVGELHKGHVLYNGQEENTNGLSQTKNNGVSVMSPIYKKVSIGIKIARRNDVLNVVKNKGTVSIKDIKFVLKDTNEKTIQRELLTLVKEGVLIKKGEKRWSTYSVAI